MTFILLIGNRTATAKSWGVNSDGNNILTFKTREAAKWQADNYYIESDTIILDVGNQILDKDKSNDSVITKNDMRILQAVKEFIAKINE